MDLRTECVLFGASRVVVGAGLLAAPALARSWVGDVVDRPGGRVAVRALGVRDLLLGAALVGAAGDRRAAGRWAAAGMVADLVDVGATAAARDRLPSSSIVAVATAAGGAATGAALWLRSR